MKTPSASSKPKTQSHLPVNITANERARNYPEGTFHVDDGGLFCSSCNVVVDHLRKFVVDKHLETASHEQNAERKDGGKQQTLKTVMNCKTVAQVESSYLSRVDQSVYRGKHSSSQVGSPPVID